MKSILSILLILSSLIAQNQQIYTLCEGNYGSSNASLWSFDDSFSSIEGPIYWDANSFPLGDIAQSIFVSENDKMYIVVNNSHTIEVMDLSSGNPVFDRTISMSGTSPRYIGIYNGSAYVSCWNLNGILVIDLDTDTFTDTISVDGLPEDILIFEDKLYVTITMDTDWDDHNIVNEIDLINQNSISKTYTVIPGPNRLLLHNNNIYVSSVYYDDAWTPYYGTSKINLLNESVITGEHGMTFAYNVDMALISNQIYRIYNNGIAPLTDLLTIDTSQQIGDIPGIYSLSTDGNNFYIGATDYVAPDNVFVLDIDGNSVAQFQVGAIPGDFAFYPPGSVSTENENELLATDYNIVSNYPNPFNPETTLRVVITRSSMTTINIFNVLGQQVVSLWNDELSIGEHLFKWDAAQQSSGVYFAVVKQGDRYSHTKMYLLK